MEFLKDLYAINKVLFKKTNKAFIKNLMLVPAVWLYILMFSTISIVLTILLSKIGQAGAFLSSVTVWLLGCYILSDYFEHIDSALSEQKFEFSKLKTGGLIHFSKVLTATAVPSIIVSLLSRLTGFNISYLVILVFLFSFAIPEIVYQKNIDGLGIFGYGTKFLKENWRHWLVINSLLGSFLSISLLLINKVYMSLFYMNNMTKLLNAINAGNVGDALIFQYITIFFYLSLLAIPFQYGMIYRGYLFKILSISSKRKREYMRNIYGK